MALLLALSDGIVRVGLSDLEGEATRVLDGGRVTSIAVDRHHPGRAYASTWDRGIWRSEDYGAEWERCGLGLGERNFTRVAVGPPDSHGVGRVYVGTEPSALHSSADDGETFDEIESLQHIPSRSEWSFPPRPYTSHVWVITVDPSNPDTIHVGIELGGIVSSFDRGRTWRDRQPVADPDCHTLRMHPKAPDRLYEAGGAWYCESRDQGKTWSRELDGLPDDLRYFYSLVVDPDDPDVRLLTAARNPFQGQYGAAREQAWSTAYRRTATTDWEELDNGFPPHEGNGMGWFANDEQTSGEFWYVTPRAEIYRSLDQGQSWKEVSYGFPHSSEATLVRAAELVAGSGS
jgi:photosystem II stability/assembly factor-like uncharacterized protein